MTASILISLESRHARNIFSGVKRVELRRRAPRVAPGTYVWIYAKMPEGAIVGRATIKQIHEASPRVLWNRFKNEVGVSRAEFFDYFASRAVGVAIELMAPRRLESPLSLEELRRVDAYFQPPQFYKHLRLNESVTSAVTAAGKKKSRLTKGREKGSGSFIRTDSLLVTELTPRIDQGSGSLG